jgi:hypothetical protein
LLWLKSAEGELPIRILPGYNEGDKSGGIHLHTRLLALIFIFLAMTLAACGDDLSEDDAEDALRAAFEGDPQDANAVFCEEDQMQEVSQLSDGVVFREVACQQQGGTHMECLSTFETANQQERRVRIVFRIKDDYLCGPTVE